MLSLGLAVQDSLVPGSTRTFTVQAPAGYFIYGEADQQTVDVVIAVTGPQGEDLGTFDRTARRTEAFQFDAEAAGTYRLAVTPFEEQSGRFSLRLVRQEQRADTPEARVDQLMAAYDADDRPGAVVAVYQDGAVRFARGYGLADLTHRVPNTSTTLFNIGSVAKQFVGIAYAMLEEQGVLSIDDDVRTYAPELPDFGETVTLRHLLNHTSGYREVYGVLALEGRFTEEDMLDRAYAMDVVRRQPELQFSPGSEYLYNSSAYVILTTLLERITGVSYPDWMQEHVFGPLGMTHTRIEREVGDVIPGSAYSYGRNERGGYKQLFDNRLFYGATDLYTNAPDLAHWLRNFRTDELGEGTVMERMLKKSVLTTGDTLGYTLGLGVGTWRGVPRIQHTGSTGGYRAFIAYFPSIDAGVAVMSNTSGFDFSIPGHVIDAFFGALLPPLPAPEPAPEEATSGPRLGMEVLAAYAGRFMVEEQNVVVYFTEAEGGLDAEIEGTSARMVTINDSTFHLAPLDARVVFHRDADGTVHSATAEQGATRYMLRRIEPWAPSAEERAGYAGRYYSEEVETGYVIVDENGQLVARHRHLDDIALTAGARDQFQGRYPLSDITFERDAAGRVSGFVVSNGRTRGVRFARQR